MDDNKREQLVKAFKDAVIELEKNDLNVVSKFKINEERISIEIKADNTPW